MRSDQPDPPTDAHLLAALRHAPDRGVTPPPGLSARILAQAQQAVAPVPAEPWWQRMRQGLGALNRLLAQPALTGALATVALTTVIGLMWRGGAPVDGGPGLAEATRPAFESVATAPAVSERRGAAEVAATAPQVLAAASPVARAKPPVRTHGETPGRPKSAPSARHSDDAARRRLADAVETSASAPVQAPAAPVTDAAWAKADPADDLVREVESAPAYRVPAAEKMEKISTPARPLHAVLDALGDPATDVRVLSVPRRSAQASTPGDAQAGELSESLRQRLVITGSTTAKASAPLSDPATAGREWLAQVARAAEGHWQPVAAPADDVRDAGLMVQVGGTAVGRLVFTDRGVLWLPVTGPAWHAELEPATLQALRAQAPRR